MKASLTSLISVSQQGELGSPRSLLAHSIRIARGVGLVARDVLFEHQSGCRWIAKVPTVGMLDLP